MGKLESKLIDVDSEKKQLTGLSEKEAKNKLEKHGPNAIVGKKKLSAFKIFFSQFKDFMVLILLVSTAISAFMGEMTEAVTIIIIVVVNSIMGFIQEYRTEKTLEALKNLAAPSAKVIRGGKVCLIPAQDIVPGDLIELEAGDRIPADALLIEAKGVQVDESLLTGESVPVDKEVDIKRSDGVSIDKSTALYMGTIVTNGRGSAIVHSTGMNTEMGKIAGMIENIDEEDTPLQKRLNQLGKLIAIGCLAICAIMSIAGILRGEELFTMLLAGISLAVAAVPEGLPAIVTIALAMGVQRMIKKNALVRKLPAVETLGCASVICSDKTGTLTENKMTVKRVYAGSKLIQVEGNGYNLDGGFIFNKKKYEPLKDNAIRFALEIAGVCNNARISTSSKDNALGKVKSLFTKADKAEVSGDPTEVALLVAGAKGGITESYLNSEFRRIDELPFDSDRKCMSVICSAHRGETVVFTKGAPDIIIKKCKKIYTNEGIVDISHSIKSDILRTNDSMAEDALRVIGVAYRKLDSKAYNIKEVERDLVFVGLIGMIDPPRKEAVEAVRKCKMAGIKPVMITGDHKITATAIAKELNIYKEGDRVLTGSELENMSERELEGIAEDVSVYARVSPKHKLMIVRVLKRLGHIVAMTGDGVNDAPAIKEADIGVAMGITGTDVTKEASSMILMDDNFATIVSAVEEGRVIYNNIRKFIRYMLACNIGEVLTMFLGMMAGLPLPLLPIQILWVNLVTDGLPAIALGLEPPDKDIMMRPPRGSKESIFSQGLLKLILFRGVLIGLSTLAVFVSILYFTSSVESARTAAFMTLVLTQLIHVFECKSERKSLFDINIFNNMALVFAVLISLVLILAVVYIPVLQVAFDTVPLSMSEWLLILGFSAVGPVLSSFVRVNR